ncbi:hypothetical protein BOTBODRAFT_163630 [Botryobasidium botryosum FD-172 SS1]|uniref:G domain-containing protein n=1 Tax=Botryobasidium botryosum (strain FD-172 SS1) TaxID=930990 RepID=A0A067M743_BOTB1|nr:hypothetical protein BOTBODRAFT_163630 [Botryobasidium botryosum FD-172 SS1]
MHLLSPTIYTSAAEILYTPDDSIEEGLLMVKVVKEHLERITTGTDLRNQIWLRDIASLESQTIPKLTIAVCGSTGTGKSTMLNAILDSQILPTSGTQACTSTPIEIGYHPDKTVVADISFLSEKEWRDELAILLHDLECEHGQVKRPADLRDESRVAWDKVHAVYPALALSSLTAMSVDQLLGTDPAIIERLGRVKNIRAEDSETFRKEIQSYVSSQNGSSDKRKAKNDPALWPLIRQVKIQCCSDALRTGAVLVDLPGGADANAARCSIADEYMKKCDRIWIVAPIQRAADNKSAKELLGRNFKTQHLSFRAEDTITFVATNCDDVLCPELIDSLELQDDPALEKVEESLSQIDSEIEDCSRKQRKTDKSLKRIEKKIKRISGRLEKYERHAEEIKGEELLAHEGIGSRVARRSKEKRRRAEGDSDDRVPKRGRSKAGDITADTGKDSNKISPPGALATDSDHGASSDGGGDTESSDDELRLGGVRLLTIAEAEATISELRDKLRSAEQQEDHAKESQKEFSRQLAFLKCKWADAQKTKNQICSLRRSEWAREILKGDFRASLKEFEDSAAERVDPDNFDPTANPRDYTSLDLPVFTVTARDYIRIKGQLKGDDQPACFSQAEDTGIPQLRAWCHKLTMQPRERAAKAFRDQIRVFAGSVKSRIENLGVFTETDRALLRRKWQTPVPRQVLQGRLRRVDSGQKTGVSRLLELDFTQAVDDNVGSLRKLFKDNLQGVCTAGALKAAATAVQTSDDLATSSHWKTYRAILRRDGEWTRNLNEDLVAPMTTEIASSWARTFEGDLFSSLETRTIAIVTKLLDDFQDSCHAMVRGVARDQARGCLEEADTTLNKILDTARTQLSEAQKDVSRRLTPCVRERLHESYHTAHAITGRGSFKQQRDIIHEFLDENKDTLFQDGANAIMEGLDEIATSIGKTVKVELIDLSKKVEANLSTLWEDPDGRKYLAGERRRTVEKIDTIIDQLTLWDSAYAAQSLPST